MNCLRVEIAGTGRSASASVSLAASRDPLIPRSRDRTGCKAADQAHVVLITGARPRPRVLGGRSRETPKHRHIPRCRIRSPRSARKRVRALPASGPPPRQRRPPRTRGHAGRWPPAEGVERIVVGTPDPLRLPLVRLRFVGRELRPGPRRHRPDACFEGSRSRLASARHRQRLECVRERCRALDGDAGGRLEPGRTDAGPRERRAAGDLGAGGIRPAPQHHGRDLVGRSEPLPLPVV
jgi:hypothetical protein